MRVSGDDIKAMTTRYRAQFVNSLSGAKSVNLVGTKNAKGQENLCIVSSCVHLGSDPALLGVVFRPNSVPRHSFENIEETGYFTLNHVCEGMHRQAHQSSARYPRDVSEFEATGLSPLYETGFHAPFVREARVRIGLKLVETLPIPLNGTTLVIGQIESVELPKECVKTDGYIAIHEAGTLAVTGLDSYHSLPSIERLKYAKPDIPLEPLDI
ncbi:MAG: flavin reductase family protein [Pseudobacteriovorax sp.]|nr:flavin reductase family protein [Pseudobacteriovorax sp.]